MTDDPTPPAREGAFSQPADPARSITLCDAPTLTSMIRFGLGWLERHQALINSLNVYPVPDGDTGTNMLLTMQSAWREIGENPEDDAGAIAQKLAHGALMGARGNSGVILSQILRGFGHGLAGVRAFNTGQFAASLREGAITAYKGVIKPVEGTILTVARESADAAAAAAADCADLRIVLEQVVHEARQSVVRTPTLLPVLAEAGVVDAGGQGLLVIFEGMLRSLRGEQLDMEVDISTEIELKAPGPAGEEGYGYDIQFIIRGNALDVEAIRETIASMGDSALIVGDSKTVKVHVHSPDPGMPISYGAKCGSLSRVIVEDMQEQYQEFLISRAQSPAAAAPLGGIGTVAVAPGEGLTQVFASLGACRVVPGGQTMNPSTEQILQAIEEVPAEEIIVLPNNKNIVLTAEQAKSLSKKRVEVIPTITVPQGIAALLALNYQADLATNARAMADAATAIETVEITTAVRSTQVNGLGIQEGDLIALIDGKIRIKGSSPVEVALAALKGMHAEGREIVTIYYGQPVSPTEAQDLAEEVRRAFPEQEVELVNGGQPHYHYIVSAE